MGRRPPPAGDAGGRRDSSRSSCAPRAPDGAKGAGSSLRRRRDTPGRRRAARAPCAPRGSSRSRSPRRRAPWRATRGRRPSRDRRGRSPPSPAHRRRNGGSARDPRPLRRGPILARDSLRSRPAGRTSRTEPGACAPGSPSRPRSPRGSRRRPRSRRARPSRPPPAPLAPRSPRLRPAGRARAAPCSTSFVASLSSSPRSPVTVSSGDTAPLHRLRSRRRYISDPKSQGYPRQRVGRDATLTGRSIAPAHYRSDQSVTRMIPASASAEATALRRVNGSPRKRAARKRM